MAATYAPPELVKYSLVEGVEGVCTNANTAADCSCDCVIDSTCENVLSGAGTPRCCSVGGRYGRCGRCGGGTCCGCAGEIC